MQKLYLGIIVVGIGLAITYAIIMSSSTTQSTSENAILVSVEKPTVNYNDTETWSVKGLPPNAEYIVTLRWADIALIVGKGSADANGEASDSFVVFENIPPLPLTLRVELASDPQQFQETSLALNNPARPMLVSVDKTSINYGDTVTWTVTGLPPNADYTLTVRSSDAPLIESKGTADTNGEAGGSFVIGENVPAGTIILRVELASDPQQFQEVILNLGM